jgi:hypothetical protein
MHEFIDADEIMEGLIIDILEVPVEIFLDAKMKETSHMETQTDLEGNNPVSH